MTDSSYHPADSNESTTVTLLPSLRRSHSWPPALSVRDSDIPDSPELVTSELPLGPRIIRNPFHPYLDSLVVNEPISSHASSKSISLASTCSTSEFSVEQKKDGFRASVSKRWVITKQTLYDKARLYREHYRAHRHKSDESPKRDSDNSLLQFGKADPVQPRKEILRRSSQRSKHISVSEPEAPPSVDTSPKTGHDEFPCKGSVTNSPHELSTGSSFMDLDEADRGRPRIEDNSSPSHPIYAKNFSSRGVLMTDSKPLLPRKSRTTSGRRHSWREPSPTIVPVHEESRTSLLSSKLSNSAQRSA